MFERKTRLFGVGLVAVLGIIFIVAQPASAQVLYGTIVGSVKDPSGGAVPGATVTVIQAQTGVSRTVTADTKGAYTISTIPAGTYDVRVSAKGFKAYDRPGLEVSINQLVRVDAVLELGAVTETVEVTSAAPLLQTDRANVSHNLTETEIQNVPMAPGNNYEQLFIAIPGINPPQSAHSISTNPSRSLAFESNGTSQIGNNIRIDGVTQTNIWVPENTAYIPSSDAIRTVNVSTNSYTPDQGLAGGSSVNVQIKSGTNHFHGDAYEYHYDNGLEARGYFDPNNGISRVPKDIFNQFGGSVGGPIKKDKLFFFVNTEFTRQRSFATRLGTVPTAAMRAGDMRGLDFASGLFPFLGGIKGKANPDVVYDPATGKANGKGDGRTEIFATDNPADPNYNSACTAATADANGQCANVIPTARLSPVTQKLLALLPMPNLPNQSSETPSNNYIAETDFSFNRWTTDDKIDWDATDKFTMYGHLGWLTYNDLNPQMFDVNGGGIGGEYIDGFGGNEGKGNGHTISTAVTANYVVSPNLVLDANFGLTRMVTDSQQLDLAKNEGLNVGIAGSNGTLFGASPRSFTGSWPEFNISSFSRMGTYDNFMPYFRNDPQFDYSGNASWIHGGHTVRFGGEVLIMHLNEVQPEWNGGGTSFGPQGGFDFAAGPTQCHNCKSGKSTSTNAYNDLATFLLGLNTNYGENFQVPDVFHTDTKEYSLYIGDTWQATGKLTANLGVRWEYYPIPTRTNGLGVERYNFQTNEMMQCGTGGVPLNCGTSVSWKLFSPRVGLAYRASHDFVIRAGYGITTDPFNLVDSLRTNFPIMIPFDVNQPNSYFAAGAMDAQSAALNAPAGECTSYAAYCINGQIPVGISSGYLTAPTLTTQPIPGNINLLTTGSNLNRGYIQSWNFTLEKDLGHGWVASAGYVATRSTNFLQSVDLNAGSPTGPAGCTPGTDCGGAASQPFNNLAYTLSGTKAVSTGNCTSIFSTAVGCRTGTTNLITPIGDFHYDSLQSQLSHHFANHYTMVLGYTWSKNIGIANVHDEKYNDGAAWIQSLQYFKLNHGLTRIDRPQKFTAMFVADAPFGSGRRWASTGFASKILGGWQVSGLLTSVSGEPFEIYANGSDLNAPDNVQRPDLIGSIKVTHNIGPGTFWFNPTAFQGVDGAPGLDQRFGTSAFYQLHGPHLFNLDAALLRNFKLSERWNLQFRAQAFNVTNTPHFGNPSGNCSSYSTTETVAGVTYNCSSSTFGRDTSIVNFARDGIDQRQFEFSARLSF